MSEFILRIFLTFSFILYESAKAKIPHSYHESLEFSQTELWQKYKLSMGKFYDDHAEDSYR